MSDLTCLAARRRGLCLCSRWVRHHRPLGLPAPRLDAGRPHNPKTPARWRQSGQAKGLGAGPDRDRPVQARVDRLRGTASSPNADAGRSFLPEQCALTPRYSGNRAIPFEDGAQLARFMYFGLGPGQHRASCGQRRLTPPAAFGLALLRRWPRFLGLEAGPSWRWELR